MTLLGYRISYKLSYRQLVKVQILTLLSSKGQYFCLIYLKMGMSEKCNNNNADKPLTSRRYDGDKNPRRTCQESLSLAFSLKRQ